MRLPALAIAALVLPVSAHAQNIGSVAATDAKVTTSHGQLIPAVSGRTTLSGASTVEASAEHSADIALAGGGSVRACQTTVVHLAESANAGRQTLTVALDRGALEIKRKAAAGDVLMTPDLRLQTAAAGPLDLRVRVVFEGDTCVENRGRHAPTLLIEDSFGESSYQVKPGQHVMFERGSLRQVDDRETTPCGCPPETDRKLSLADAALSGRPDAGGKTDPAAAHPFPAAESAGLAPNPAPGVPEKPGETHLEIATTLDYDPNAPTAATPLTQTGSPSMAAAQPASPQPLPAKAGPLTAIGNFFKHLFVH